ncbi:MAG: phosphoadenylyl-sulfate reductase [Thermoplasmata archaeon]
MAGRTEFDQAAAWSREFEGRDPGDVVRWAFGEFGSGLVIGSSFGKDSLVVLDIARKIRPDVPVLFLETGYHFAETLQFRDELRRDWNANIVDLRPEMSVPEQDAAFGFELFARDPDRCCAMRKVAPLHRALRGQKAWMTGLRRSQHAGRGATPVVEWQELTDGGGLYKVNPIVGWSLERVESYLQEHRVPPHPLWSKGYPSVGCAPCTSPVAAGEDERAGRWRHQGKVECGIHGAGVRRTGSELNGAVSASEGS